MTNVLLSVILFGLAIASQGCGVYMAFTQPEKVDIEQWKSRRLMRRAMIEEIGPPKVYTKNPDGSTREIYEFYEGTDPGWSIARGVFHLAADFFTLALWEVVATPIEFAYRGDKLTAEAEFDSEERLRSITVLNREIKPLERIHKQQNGASG
jgi:hypothetical protein